MRLTETLTIPDDLEAARAAGELVIFAGAGVSVPPPSNLPNFVQLAKEIGEPLIPLSKQYEASLDRYLGRAALAGLDVQARARQLLSAGGSHTAMHEHLLALFGGPDRLRLVTTNFDTHFSTALAALYPRSKVRTYVGPALPPGQHFRGVAQLHGSLEDLESKLILTDQDFAEAYMAEGWASRFLTRLFADRAVLFVGYSLSDPIMQYLLRGIPPNGRWFALWPHRDVNRGIDYRVTGIGFGKPRAKNPYSDLNRGVELWRRYSSMSSADHAQQIRDLVRNGPPASPYDTDYLRARLESAEGRTVFCETAIDEAWFWWIAAAGYLQPLLQVDSKTVASEWIGWCLEKFCEGLNPPFLRYARERSLVLQHAFAGALLVHLWRSAERMPPSSIMQFVALLANSSEAYRLNEELLGYLIGSLAKHGHTEATFVLLRAATRIELAHNLPYERLLQAEQSTESVPVPLTSKIKLRAGSGQLEDLLNDAAGAIVAQDPTRVLNLAEGRLLEAYEMLRLASGGHQAFDLLSYERASIGEVNQRRSSSAVDVLVDLATLAFRELAERQADELLAFASRYESQDRTLLTRLALFALSVSPTTHANEILRRAGVNKWLTDWQLRSECYAMLKTHFPSAAPTAQAQFIEIVSTPGWWTSGVDQDDSDERFNLALYLARVAPDSQAAVAFANRERLANPHGVERATELHYRTSASWEPEEHSPYNAVELGRLDPDTALIATRTSIVEAQGIREAHALMAELQLAVRANPPWGVRLLILAFDEDSPDRRIVDSALFGLREAEVSPVDQQALLNRVTKSWPAEHARTIGSVLLKWCDGLKADTTADLLDAYDAAADVLFARSALSEPGTIERGWTERSINHAAGYAAQIWWTVAERRNKTDGVYVPALSDAERDRWLRILTDTTSAGDFARPILGMATDRLSSADLPWTIQHILPSFSPALGRQPAAQLWDGRLMQTRFFWGTLQGLRKPLTAFLKESGALVPSRSRQLGDFIALLVANKGVSKFTRVDLHHFIQGALPEARVAFADALPVHLSRLESSERVAVWSELLAPYWRDRRTNMPLKLAPEELAEMLYWALELSEVADDVVEALLSSPTDRLASADSIIFRWQGDSSWIAKHPVASVGLMRFLLERGAISSWFGADVVAFLAQAKDAGAPLDAIKQAVELLIKELPQISALAAERLLR